MKVKVNSKFHLLVAPLVALILAACGTATGTSTQTTKAGTPEVQDTTEAAAVSEDVVDMDPNTLLELMLYHLTPRVYMALALAVDDSVMTMSADSIAVTDPGSTITLNGDVQVVEEDIEACNGVIHIIDQRLTKPDVNGSDATAPPEPPATAAVGQGTPEPTSTPCDQGQTIAKILLSRPDLSNFTGALEAVGLLDMLDRDGKFTVFAPPNGVFVPQTTDPDEAGTSGTPGTPGTSGTPGSGTPGTSDENEKVTICHATGSETNPYVMITVSVNGLNGHGGHAGDIIPAPAEGCPTATP